MGTNTVKSIKKYINLENIALLIIAVQILFIIYMNTVRCSAYPELDMAKLYRHAIEMANNHSLIIPGWNYITTMELDCSLLFAVPLYEITHNIFISFGIANIIFLVIYLFVIFDILNKIEAKKLHKYIAVIVFLIPYRAGMLEYFNMMFYNGGQYVVKVLVPLILIDLMLDDPLKQWSVKNIVLTVLFAFLMIITSMSSGTYVLMSGILPIVAAYFLNIVIDGDFKKIRLGKIILIAISFAAFIIGYVLCKVLEVSPNSEAMELISPNHFVENIFTTFWGYLSIFIPENYPGVISRDGIIQLLRYGMAIAVIILLVWNITRLFKSGEDKNIQRFLMLPFIWTSLILNLTLCCFSDVFYPERYFFIGLVPLFLTIPYFLEDAKKTAPSELGYKTLVILLGGFITLLLLANIYDVRREVGKGYNGGYRNVPTVIDYARSEGIENIFWLYNLPDGEVARMYAPEIKSGVINFYDDGTAYMDTARDFYYAENDNMYYVGRNLLIEKKGSGDYERMPEYIRSYYVPIGEVGGYNAYISETNRLDNMSGAPAYGMNVSKDFLYTKDYQVFGDITEGGYLNAVGSDMYSALSPIFRTDNSDVVVNVEYEVVDAISGECGNISILDENYAPVVSSIMTDNGVQTATLNAAAGGTYYICMSPSPGTVCNFYEVTYEVAK